MPVSQYAQKAMLDWIAGGATPAAPTIWAVGLSLGTPASNSASEASVSAYSRQLVTFAAATTPAGSASVSNVNAFTFTVSSACTLKGYQVWDTRLSSGSGNMLFYGLLSASSVMVAGDTLAIPIGSLKITLS